MIADTRITLETPEGTDLPLYPTGFWTRTLAYTLDIFIRMITLGIVGIVFNRSGVGMGLFLITAFLFEWFYPVFFEVTRAGQTPGKKLLKIKVINDDGTPVTFAASLIRNLLRTIDFLPLFYICGIVTSVCNRQFKRLGDLAAGTLVVYANPAKEIPTLEPVGSCPVPDDFSTDEQRILLAFAQRSQSITLARQQELAQIISPLLQGSTVSTTDPVKTIKKMGNHIVGIT